MDTKNTKKDYVSAVGRRKQAIARIRLMPNAGSFTVNGKLINEYFQGEISQKAYLKPFEITETLGKFSGSILVSGGGSASQLGATIHGLSRALSLTDTEKFRGSLKKAGLLTRDARVKERLKFGLAHAARAKKQSPKR